jgi:ferredoxin/coenzyme F420-reducing hydrogenase delta subunit
MNNPDGVEEGGGTGMRTGARAAPGGGGAMPAVTFRVLSRADALLNRVYGARWNPLYHSGALAIALLLVLVATGLYLLVFYRVGDPYGSVARINDDVWLGGWVRALHRYASAGALVAVAVHAFRMYAQRRTWGPRALAWVSGVALLVVVLLTGWTGYVLVWDTHALVLALEGARLLDALPFFSEPIGRAFVGEAEVHSGFFFVNLFAHIALPLGLAALVWVHVARVSRPVLLPARRVLWGAVLGLAAVSAAWPLAMAPAADVLAVPTAVPLDWFYGFWLPLTQRLPAWLAWLLVASPLAVVTAVPWLTRPAAALLPAPARVHERVCTGCEQCVHDCPYDAIEMVPRQDGRGGEVARVRAELCTRCGICIGACAPMAIGPMAVTARDQVAEVRAFVEEERPGEGDVVIVGCTWSAARDVAGSVGAGYLAVGCVGAMHSSTVELLLRGGAGGVLVVGCPAHDGRTRDGAALADERLFGGRPADLKPRVDRRRVRLVQATVGEAAMLHGAALAFAAEIDALAGAAAGTPDDAPVDVVALCRAAHRSADTSTEDVA